MNGPGARSSCETSLSTQTGHVRGLAPVEVPGHTRRGENGGANDPEEADAVVAWVLTHLDEPGTLEVVTPFAAQAALITARLTAALGASAWDAKNVTVGTAHRFQGDERDVMLLSTVLAADAIPELKVVVEGYELDFALDSPTGPLDIEVDGVHHTDTRGRQRRQDLARDQILESMGWRVLRIPAWRCLAEPDRVAADVDEVVGATAIASQGRHAG
ncbi:MAG: endonuclease domain-containing protein [Cellulomonas sp.]